MKSVRRTIFSRLGIALPSVALAVTGTLAAIAPSEVAPLTSPKSQNASFADRAPIAKLDRMYQVPGGVHATGWTFDPSNAPQALSVVSTVDGAFTNTVTASLTRSDVVPANAGTGHGFALNVPVPEGRHTVCLTAVNVGAGSDYRIGCLTAVLDYGPYGSIDVADTRPGAVQVKGWLVDADSLSAPVTAIVTIDGVDHEVVADASRPDVARTHTGVGAMHGFSAAFAASQGTHTVCVTGRNLGHGSNNSLGCRTVVLNDSPIVHTDSMGASGGKLAVRGWAVDMDTPLSALSGVVRVDDGPFTEFTANTARTDVGRVYPGTGTAHGFDVRVAASEGTHTACYTIRNKGYGAALPYTCRTVTLDYTPTAAANPLVITSTGVRISGWAADPDTTAPISVRLTVDGALRSTVTANGKGATHSGHNFSADLATTSGTHTVCATGVNVLSGTGNSDAMCRQATLVLKPLASVAPLTRSGNNVRVTGWAFDPDSSGAASVTITVDGNTAGTYRATLPRTDVARAYPSAGAHRGFDVVVPASSGQHTVCVTAENIGAGSDVDLGCRLIIGVNAKVPGPPLAVKAISGYGAGGVSWTAPASDGGAPVTAYTVTASPGGVHATVSGSTRTTTISGLQSGTSYFFTVRAVNAVGTSAAGFSPRITTQTGPAPQTTPAPVSTSRYIRNIRTCSAAESAQMRSFGATDAASNPAGHRYMMLLDIGGQNQSYGGVVLSATTRFVTYANLLNCSKSYVAGYAGAQKSAAPAIIAIGVNNDMDVNASTGRDWATKIVNPLVSYARSFSGITIAGANDIEPGFSASYAATRNWVSGYLAATTAKFIFNGSADGCAWTVTNRGCNNGWTMAGLYNLAAGAAPAQILNLPQVYNYTMADQWKYISLTGVGSGQPRINFGGPLTEVTACAQAHSCDSIGGYNAWKRLWSNLQSHPSLRVGSLPYATDLRIDS